VRAARAATAEGGRGAADGEQHAEQSGGHE